jgi:hypothetical protein
MFPASVLSASGSEGIISANSGTPTYYTKTGYKGTAFLWENGFWLLAFGCRLLAVGFWLSAFGCWLLAAGFWLLAFGCWLLAVGFWLSVSGIDEID